MYAQNNLYNPLNHMEVRDTSISSHMKKDEVVLIISKKFK